MQSTPAGPSRYLHMYRRRRPLSIVYVDFVDDVHPLAVALREEGLTTCAYHGKRLTSHDKKKALESWSSGQCQVMVCTTAFGMGIDTPDTDLVVQIECSSSIEQMVQQMGRADRDGHLYTGMEFVA